jgi:hypothetical protein
MIILTIEQEACEQALRLQRAVQLYNVICKGLYTGR